MPADSKPRKRTGSEQYHDAFKPDPKPRKRVKDRALMSMLAEWPSQIPRKYPDIVTHHLTTNPRHDEAGNLMRIPSALHHQFHSGPGKMEAAAEIREWMNKQQIAYVIRERGEAWLDKTYPPS